MEERTECFICSKKHADDSRCSRKMGKEMGFSIVGVKNKSHLFFKKKVTPIVRIQLYGQVLEQVSNIRAHIHKDYKNPLRELLI